MTQEEFIAKHVRLLLLAEGYPEAQMKKAQFVALNFYRKTAKFKTGKAFDESLQAARVVLGSLQKKKKRVA